MDLTWSSINEMTSTQDTLACQRAVYYRRRTTPSFYTTPIIDLKRRSASCTFPRGVGV